LAKRSTLFRGIYVADPVEKTAVEKEKNTGKPEFFCYIMLSGLDHPKAILDILFERSKSFQPIQFSSVNAFLTAHEPVKGSLPAAGSVQ
jgi:hypothetical protein